MPFYDYVCSSCGTSTEVMHGVNDEIPRTCPECGAPVTKAFAAPAIHFKGSGWAKKERHASQSQAMPKAKATPPAPGEPVPTTPTTPTTSPTASTDAAGAKAPGHSH